MNLDTQIMNKIYTIYHIPEFVYSDGSIGKIGVSYKLNRRIKANLKKSLEGFTNWEVLEEHTDIYKVSDREIELQREYGYKVDTILYWKMLLNVTKEGCSKGGKAAGKIALESGRWAEMARIGNSKENREKAAISIKKTIKEKGLHKGEKNGRAKLTEANVVEIRKLYESGKVTNKAELGRMFNVSDSMIRYVVQYKSWN